MVVGTDYLSNIFTYNASNYHSLNITIVTYLEYFEVFTASQLRRPQLERLE